MESQKHKEEGCASCDEIEYFKKDIMKVATATGSEDILGRAEDLCKSIDIMVGHVARTANQVTKCVCVCGIYQFLNHYTGTFLAGQAGRDAGEERIRPCPPKK